MQRSWNGRWSLLLLLLQKNIITVPWFFWKKLQQHLTMKRKNYDSVKQTDIAVSIHIWIAEFYLPQSHKMNI